MELNKQNSAATCVITKEENKEHITFEKKASQTLTFKTLKLKKQVSWSEDTVDNEFLNKKKSNSKNTDNFSLLYL